MTVTPASIGHVIIGNVSHDHAYLQTPILSTSLLASMIRRVTGCGRVNRIKAHYYAVKLAFVIGFPCIDLRPLLPLSGQNTVSIIRRYSGCSYASSCEVGACDLIRSQ